MTKIIPIIAESVPVTVTREEGGPGHFSMVAYTGGKLSVPGYKHPIVLDLSGVKFRRNVLANLDHDSKKRVGQVTDPSNDGKQITLAGTLSAATDSRMEVIESSKDGFDWEASIEALPYELEFVPVGQQVFVNQQKLEGPVFIARSSLVFGVAFVGQGADEQTVTTIAASAENISKGLTMSFEEWASAQGFEVAALSESQTAFLMKCYTDETVSLEAMSDLPEEDPKPSMVASFDIDSLKAIYAEHESNIEGAVFASAGVVPTETLAALKAKALGRAVQLKQKAIASKHRPDQFRLATVQASADLKVDLIRAERPKGPSIHASSRDMSSPVIEAAFAKTRGILNEKEFDDKTLQASHTQFRNGIGLQQLLIMAASMNGMHFSPGDGINSGNIGEVMRHSFGGPVRAAGFTTISVPGILSNVANKEILAGYEEEDQTWKEIAAIKSVKDFKVTTSYRMLDNMLFERVGASGEIRHGTLSEETYTRQADTYAKMASVTRRDIINDDLGAFDDMRNRIGRGGAQRLNQIFWTAFMNNGSFFTAGRGNFIVGAASTLLTDGVGLQQGLTAFRKLKTPVADGEKRATGESIGGRPEILLVPPELEFASDKLYVGSNLSIGNAAGEENIHRNKYRTVVCPWLSDTAFAGNSATAWHLLRNPAAMPSMIVSFLNGNQTPTVESADADFSTLGVQFRGYFDFGCDLAEYLSGIKSKGAA